MFFLVKDFWRGLFQFSARLKLVFLLEVLAIMDASSSSMNNDCLDSCSCLDDMSHSSTNESLVVNESIDNQMVGHIPVKMEPTESPFLLDAFVSKKESRMDEFRFCNDVTKYKCIQTTIKEVTKALNPNDS